MRSFPLVCLLLWIWAGCAAAQLLPKEHVPPPPPNGLYDEFGVLGKNPDVQRRLIALIRDLEDQHGFKLYLVFDHKMILTTPSNLANQLFEEWLPDGGGLVIVFEADTRKIRCGYELEQDGKTTEGNPEIPSYEMEAILSKGFRKVIRSQSWATDMEAAVVAIDEGIRDYYKRKSAPPEEGRSLKLALVAVGALSLLALVGMLLGWLMGKADKKQSRRRAFPPTEMPERLSAPYGGGGGGYCRFDGRS